MTFDCQTCGACCRGLGVDVSPIHDKGVPERMVKDDRLMGPQMRVKNGVCVAMCGQIGVKSRCSIYERRPQVCRDFEPGSSLCMWARKQANLPHELDESVLLFDLRAQR